MISHQRAQELISARFDQPLDPIDNRELLTHLATCPTCQRFAEQANVLARGLRDLPHHPASPSVNRQVLERISAGRSPWSKLGQIFSPSRSPVAVATAALVIIAVAAFVVILRSGVEPQSHFAAPGGVTATFQARATATQPSTLAQATNPTPTAIATATQPPIPTATATTQTQPTTAPTSASTVATVPPPVQAAETATVPSQTIPTEAAPTATPTSRSGIVPANELAPTATATATLAPVATSTPAPTVTATETPEPTATVTPVPTATETPTEVPTATPTPTAVPTDTPTPTEVPTEPPVDTVPKGGPGSPVALPPERVHPTPTPTEPPPPPTATPSPTPVPTATATATPTQSIQPVSGDQGPANTSDPPISQPQAASAAGNNDPALTSTPPAIVPRQSANLANQATGESTTTTAEAQNEGQASDASPVAQPTTAPIESGRPPRGSSGSVATDEPTPPVTVEATSTSGVDIASADMVAKLPSGSSAPAGPLHVAASDDAVVILGPDGVLGVDEFSNGYAPLGGGVSQGIWSPKGILLLVSYLPSDGGTPSIAVFDRDTGNLKPITQQASDEPAHRDIPAGWIGQDLYYLRTFSGQSGRVELHRAFYDGSDDQVIWSSDQLSLLTDQPIPTGNGFLIATGGGWLLVGSDGQAGNMGGGLSGGAITQGSVSPNGDLVAYVDGGQLVIAPIKSPGSAIATLPYSGADGTGYSWSPSGRYLVISDGQTLHIYANDGTPLQTVANSGGTAIGAPSWQSDGIWFVVPGDPATIRRISNDALTLPS